MISDIFQEQVHCNRQPVIFSVLVVVTIYRKIQNKVEKKKRCSHISYEVMHFRNISWSAGWGRLKEHSTNTEDDAQSETASTNSSSTASRYWGLSGGGSVRGWVSPGAREVVGGKNDVAAGDTRLVDIVDNDAAVVTDEGNIVGVQGQVFVNVGSAPSAFTSVLGSSTVLSREITDLTGFGSIGITGSDLATKVGIKMSTGSSAVPVRTNNEVVNVIGVWSWLRGADTGEASLDQDTDTIFSSSEVQTNRLDIVTRNESFVDNSIGIACGDGSISLFTSFRRNDTGTREKGNRGSRFEEMHCDLNVVYIQQI